MSDNQSSPIGHPESLSNKLSSDPHHSALRHFAIHVVSPGSYTLQVRGSSNQHLWRIVFIGLLQDEQENTPILIADIAIKINIRLLPWLFFFIGFFKKFKDISLSHLLNFFYHRYRTMNIILNKSFHIK